MKAGEDRRVVYGESGRSPACARAVPHRQFLRKGPASTATSPSAKTWYQMAAEQGNASAHAQSGSAVCDGRRRHVRQRVGARWFLNAAEPGVGGQPVQPGTRRRGRRYAADLQERNCKWFALVAAKRDEIANAPARAA
jgi:localization factor PodJL